MTKRPHYGTTALLSAPTTSPPSSPPPPPPATLPILPDELIVEILVRLPVRSLLQFRRVCKSWKTLISSSQFAKDHLQRSFTGPTMTHPRLVYSNHRMENCRIGFCSVQSLLENPSAPTKVVCSQMEMDDVLLVLGSCNGLLCLYALFSGSVRLWNPCTGLASEWLESEQKGRVTCHGFGYDHAHDNHKVTCHGFGYDHVHDKYKLLAVFGEPWVSVTTVCTFGANSWTTVQDFPLSPVNWNGQFVSGTLNWMAEMPDTTNQWVIVSFDLAKETFGQLSLPDMNDDNLCKPSLQVLRNCLCVCFDHKKTHWDVWLMKEYGVEQSWTKLAMISHVELQHYRSYHPLELVYMSENDVVLAIRPTNSKLVLCNTNDGHLDYPLIDSSSDEMLNYPMGETVGPRVFDIYLESLVSPLHCGL